MGYDIVTLETQNHGQDWPLIVTAVECPTCGAPVGEMCHAVGTTEGPVATHPMVMTGQVRIDWHAARKQNAAAAWYTRDTSAHQPPAAPPPPGGLAVHDDVSEINEAAIYEVPQSEGEKTDLTHVQTPYPGPLEESAGPSAFAGDKTKTATGKKKGAPPPPPPPPSK